MKTLFIVISLAILCHYVMGECYSDGICKSGTYCNDRERNCKECDGYTDGLCIACVKEGQGNCPKREQGVPSQDESDETIKSLTQDKVQDDGFVTKSEAESSRVSVVLIVVTICSLIFGLMCCIFGGFMWFRRGKKALIEVVANEDDEDDGGIEETHEVPFKETITM
eukprot:324190_1